MQHLQLSKIFIGAQQKLPISIGQHQISTIENIWNYIILFYLFISQIKPRMLVSRGVNYIRRRYYCFVGKTIHYFKARWLMTLCVVAMYFYRVAGLSYDVITYLIGFYLLQLVVGYLTPKGLEECPQQQYDQITDSDILPIMDVETLMQDNFEFQNTANCDKPLVSSLSEFQIWERITFAFILGIICTMFKSIEIDVFWPLLMIYFVVLVSYTIHKIVRKMRKYQYSISDFNKKAAEFFR